MPHLSDLWSEVSSQRKDVAFLSVNIGDSPQVIAAWWQSGRFTQLPVMQEGDSVSRAFGVSAYPTNYVIGPDGRVQWRGIGYDEAALRKAFGLPAR